MCRLTIILRGDELRYEHRIVFTEVLYPCFWLALKRTACPAYNVCHSPSRKARPSLWELRSSPSMTPVLCGSDSCWWRCEDGSKISSLMLPQGNNKLTKETNVIFLRLIVCIWINSSAHCSEPVMKLENDTSSPNLNLPELSDGWAGLHVQLT